MVAPYTGMRRGELLQLRARDVDLGANLIHVGGLPDFQTKASNYRTIPIHEAIITIMRERLEHASPSTRVFDDWSSGDCLMRAFRRFTSGASSMRGCVSTASVTASAPGSLNLVCQC